MESLIYAARELSEIDIESGIEVDKAMLMMMMTNNENDTALHETPDGEAVDPGRSLFYIWA